MIKIFKNSIFMFILGAIIFSSITGAVAYTYQSKDIKYSPKDSSWKVDNVSDALDNLKNDINNKYKISKTYGRTESTTYENPNTKTISNLTINKDVLLEVQIAWNATSTSTNYNNTISESSCELMGEWHDYNELKTSTGNFYPAWGNALYRCHTNSDSITVSTSFNNAEGGWIRLKVYELK